MYVIKGHILRTDNKGIQVANLQIFRSGGNITYTASYCTSFTHCAVTHNLQSL